MTEKMRNKKIQIHARHPIWECRGCRECPGFNRFFRIFLPLLLCIVFTANSPAQNLFFQNGEELHYDIRYKYGLIVMKGGTACYHLNTATYNRKQAVKSSLDFKTSLFFDKIFKIRDTLDSYAGIPDCKPLYHSKIVNEGGFHLKEEVFIRKHGSAFSEVKIKQARGEEVRIDTILSSNSLGFDLLNIFLFVRNLDYSTITPNETYPVTIFMGRKKVNLIICYTGPAIVKKNDTTQYNAFRFTVDIADEVFSESKNAMEIWVSDDPNHIPLKMKAKLKIGAAEANLSSYKNLKYPLSSEINLTPEE
jgi:hypothetical protein